MTIPNKFNPFGISRRSKLPTKGLVFYAPLKSDVSEMTRGNLSTYGSYTFTNQAEIDCVKFNSGCIYTNTQGNIPIGQNLWTVSLWVKGRNSGGMFFEFGAPAPSSSDRGTSMYAICNGSNSFWVGFYNGSGSTDIQTRNFSMGNKWHHIVIQRTSSLEVKIYIDGVLNAYTSNLDPIPTLMWQGLYIGSNRSFSEKYTGHVAAVRLYDRVLTDNEITLLYNEFTPKYTITASDQNYTFTPIGQSSASINYSTDGTVNSFQIISGSLPSNISFNTSTGTFTGIATTDADHTYNLVIRISGPDVITKDINYTIYTKAMTTLTAPSPQTFNFITESEELILIEETDEGEYVAARKIDGSFPTQVVQEYVGKDVGFRSWGIQTANESTTAVMALSTILHPDPVYVTCNFNITLNQISANNQTLTFYTTEGETSEKINYTSQNPITPVYNISGTLPSGVTFDSSTGVFTSDGTQTTQETQTIQMEISSSTGYSSPATFTVVLDVKTTARPIPTDYIFYAPLSSTTATAETGQTLSYKNSPSISNVQGIDCLKFSGSQGVSTTNKTNLPTGNAPWTMSIWGYALMRNVHNTYFSMGYNSNYRGTLISVTDNNIFNFGLWGGDVISNTVYKKESWVNLIQTYDGTTIKGYLNGELIASGNRTANLYYGGIYIGNLMNNYNPYYGYLAAARIYNRAITSGEINALSKEFTIFYLPDQNIYFSPLSGVETYTLNYTTNTSDSVIFGLSGNLPSGVTFDSTSGIFTSDGTQTANETSSVIISASFTSDPTTMLASANIKISVVYEQMIPNDYVFYAPLKSLNETAAETGQSILSKTVGNKVIENTIDGIPCLTCIGVRAREYWAYEETGLPYGSSDRTVSVWLNINDNDKYHSHIIKYGVTDPAPNQWFRLFRQQVDVAYYNADFNSTTNADLNVWQHFAVTFEHTENSNQMSIKVYVNGVYSQTVSQNLNTVDDGSLFVFASNWEDGYLNGSITSLRIYDRVLSVAEIAQLAAEFTPTT